MRRLGDVFGLASTLTNEKLRHNFWENVCFTAALYAQLRREKPGAAPLSAATLDTVFRNWLYYRGFHDTDIEELEFITNGDLTLGLMQIRSILANRVRDRMGVDGMGYRGYRGKYDPDTFKKIAALFKGVYERRFESLEMTKRHDSSTKW